MIPAAKHPWVERWFRGYVRRYLRASFHRVLLVGEIPERPPGPLLVCMSHSSWWDVLLAFWLSREVLPVDSYGPMDQRQVERYRILTRIGVFGVDRETLDGGRDFVCYAQELLEGKDRALWITAQGAMVSPDLRPVRLYSGIGQVARQLDSCHVCTVALDYVFWDEKRPEVLVHFGEPFPVTGGRGMAVRPLLRDLEQRLETSLDLLAAVRTSRDPSRCQVLLHGRSGISPVYDSIRHSIARLRGQPLEASHGARLTPPRWGPSSRGD
ncbi:MAG: 1-acyl-sn-glycerol-3-phosphate acyltransferase [Armatimonadetes bacterium]|jgi:1-acyl-sn-glycerol-3-phosphate acyltransferase|nr:1-acyl-sn-glycerol-3-phosphate acyltransferase [Armatimonadota bacterium]